MATDLLRVAFDRAVDWYRPALPVCKDGDAITKEKIQSFALVQEETQRFFTEHAHENHARELFYGSLDEYYDELDDAYKPRILRRPLKRPLSPVPDVDEPDVKRFKVNPRALTARERIPGNLVCARCHEPIVDPAEERFCRLGWVNHAAMLHRACWSQEYDETHCVECQVRLQSEIVSVPGEPKRYDPVLQRFRCRLCHRKQKQCMDCGVKGVPLRMDPVGKRCETCWTKAHDPRPRVVKLKRTKAGIVQDCQVYIGRKFNMGGWNLPQSDWHNPYKLPPQQRRECLAKYEAHVRARPDLMARLGELSSKTLGCWCFPDPCHGDVLVKLVMETVPRQSFHVSSSE